jgi:hypothetical protein
MPLRHGRNDAGFRAKARILSAGVIAIVALAIAALAPAGVSAEGSSVSIVVWACPPGTTPESVSLADCENASVDTVFTLTSDPSSMSLTWTTGSIEGSGSGIEGIAPGTYSVTQQGAVEGAYSSFWRCGELGAGGRAPAYSEGETLELTIETDGAWRCDWIVVPSSATPVADAPDGVGTVSAVAFLCPPTVSQSSSYTDLIEACPVPPAENISASFSAWDNPPTISQGEGRSYDESGIVEVVFDELPAGPIVVVETIPDGYGDPVVYCSDTGDPSAGEPKSYTERIQWVLADDVPLTCHFFNFPA